MHAPVCVSACACSHRLSFPPACIDVPSTPVHKMCTHATLLHRAFFLCLFFHCLSSFFSFSPLFSFLKISLLFFVVVISRSVCFLYPIHKRLHLPLITHTCAATHDEAGHSRSFSVPQSVCRLPHTPLSHAHHTLRCVAPHTHSRGHSPAAGRVAPAADGPLRRDLHGVWPPRVPRTRRPQRLLSVPPSLPHCRCTMCTATACLAQNPQYPTRELKESELSKHGKQRNASPPPLRSERERAAVCACKGTSHRRARATSPTMRAAANPLPSRTVSSTRPSASTSSSLPPRAPSSASSSLSTSTPPGTAPW